VQAKGAWGAQRGACGGRAVLSGLRCIRAALAAAVFCAAAHCARAPRQQVFTKAVAEAAHFEATGGAAGGQLPAGMTSVYNADLEPPPAPAPPPAAPSTKARGCMRARARGGGARRRGCVAQL
jgi:hypothetical protein